MSEPVVAVIDIGKTNKKIHIYNRELEMIDSRNQSFGTTLIDGVPFEKTDELMEWLLDNLSALAARHEIAAVSTSCHGAAFACVDESGELSVPVVDYTYEPGEDFHDEFYDVAGDRDDLQRTTATLELKALVNPAKGIYFLKQRFPDQFARTHRIIMYDQYFPFKLSGSIVSDPTYTACHTYLFDHRTVGYSAVAERLGVRSLLPERFIDPGEEVGLILPEIAARTGLSPLTRILAGVHDSNASLVPYLITRQDDDFIVNSTGTWCVAMHPEKEIRFSDDEIGKAVFYNMSVFREPVKTTILMGGLEFETYTELLARDYGLSGYPAFDPAVYRDVAGAAQEFILPAVVQGTGQYPDSEARIVDHGETIPLTEVQSGKLSPRLFRDPRRAFAALNLSLALQTVTALRRVGLRPGVRVFTEGGFRGNRDYNALLAALVPEATFRLSGMPEATSFGTALLGWAAVEGRSVRELADRFHLEEEAVSPADIAGLADYARTFHAQLE